MDNSEICAICGGVYGLHNHMNKACPKDINADRNHTEYRRTVFSSTPQPLIMEGQTELLDCYFTPGNKTTSATICANCGKDRMAHTIGEGIKATSILINPKAGQGKEVTAMTAMQDWNNELTRRLLIIKSEPDGIVREQMINDFLIGESEWLAKEREQIEKAFKDPYKNGRVHPGNNMNKDFETYFTNTY